jgi:hypothetical protein
VKAARAKGVQLHILKAAAASEIDGAFASLVQLHAGALVISVAPFFLSRREQLIALTSSHVIPAIYVYREFAATQPHQLWTQPDRRLSQGRHLRRKGSQQREAGRSAGSTADAVRVGRQSQYCKGTGPLPSHPRSSRAPTRSSSNEGTEQ